MSVELNRMIERRLNAMLRYTELADKSLRDNACHDMSEAIESASWEGGRAESYILVKANQSRARAADSGWYHKKFGDAKRNLEAVSRKFHLRCLRKRYME
jgi:hypothetical protein